jgi:uncharacterized glyoxalase superfamily protein PhnB
MSSPAIKPIPDGMHSLTPHLTCAGATDAIAFYTKAFDATELTRLEAPKDKITGKSSGKLVHAMLKIGDSALMLMDESTECGMSGPKALKGTAVTIHLYVANVDETLGRAAAAGATVLMPAADMFWGDRYAVLEDPFGHRWSVATHVRDVSPDDMQAAMCAMQR